MGTQDRAITVDELLAQAAWLRGLALRIAGDADDADDLVQETYVAAVRHRPEARASARPWLARVLRNAARMRARGDQRREARERATSALAGEVPTPESLVAKAEAHRRLAGLVLRLDEPYRGTVLMHFFEGISLADIARAQGLSAGTVRWRLKVALDRLRAWIDAESDGGRLPALAPLIALPTGVAVAGKTSKVVVGVLVLVLLLAVGGGVFLWQRGGGGDSGEQASRRTGTLPIEHRPSGGSEGGRRLPAWLVQPDVEPRRIAGRVTFRGEPVAGATVELANLATESSQMASPRLATNAAGEFDFGEQPAVEWSVRASAPGKTAVALALDLRNPTGRPPSDRLELALGACDAAMVGVVRDASGGPAAGAHLARLPMSGVSAVPGGAGTTAAEDGSYELCLEAAWPGQVVVEVSADGYGAIVYTGQILGRVKVDFSLVPEAVIVGRVVRDDTGEPVPKAHVYVPRGAWAMESTSWRGAFTDAEGRFRIDRIAPGRHLVFARADGMEATARGTPVVVEAAQTTREIELRLRPGAVVRGVVRRGDAPVAGARVAAATADGRRGARTAVSQADGSFVLSEVPFGQVRFTGWPYHVVKPDSIRIDRAEHDGIVLEVEDLGAIVGTVTRHRAPAAGALVQIHGPNDWQLDPIRTGADGRFEARGLEPGPWTLFAQDERVGAFGRAPEIVRLERGATEEVAIDLAYGASVSGRVVDQAGQPVPGVSVELVHTAQDDVGVGITSTDGSFRAAMMLGGGTYRTAVRPYKGATSTLPPAEGTELPSIELPGPDSAITGVVLAVRLDDLSIGGRVVDSSGAPMADVRVAAVAEQPGRPPRWLRWLPYDTAVTDVNGRFAIADLAAGTYALQARSPAGAVTTAGGVRAGRDDVVITLPAPGAIEGTLTGFDGEPQVLVLPTDTSASIAVPRASIRGGSFHVPDLSPGTYVVTAQTAAEAASARVTVLAGATATVSLEAGGSGSISGVVREFRSGEPVEGMSCLAVPRVGNAPAGDLRYEPVRTDAEGRFAIPAAPAGDIFVRCAGLWHLYSDGIRLIALEPSRSLEVEVPVVARQGDVAGAMGGLGARFPVNALDPRLVDVEPGGPAAAAGLRDGDRVSAVDGDDVTELSPIGVWLLITNRPPGTTVELQVVRKSRTVTAEVVLGPYEPW